MADGSITTSSGSAFTITIDDTSPTIVYEPSPDTFGSPDVITSWNPYYSGSGFAPGVASGTSWHVTAANGGSFAIRWNGTGISIYGRFPTSSSYYPTLLSYTVALDGIPTTNYASSTNYENSILASFTNLTYGEHLVVLAMRNPQLITNETLMLEFDRAIVVSTVPRSTVDTTSHTVMTQTIPDDSIAYRGQWSYDTDMLPGQNMAFHTSNKVGDRASLTFNGTAITLSGLTTPLSGSYNVTIDGEGPTTFSARSSFNASEPTVLFYRTGLDLSVSHHLEITNAGALHAGEGTLLVFGSVNTTGASEEGGTSPIAGMSSSGLPQGVVAAIAVCVSIGFLALVAFIFYLRSKHRARRKEGFLVNPRARNRRFSFLPRTSFSVGRNKEKEAENRRRDSFPAHPRKEEDEESHDGGDTMEDGRLRYLNTLGQSQVGHPPQGSPNEDGSYNIQLPEFAAQGHPYVMAAYDIASPIRSPSAPEPQVARSPTFSLPPNSKPRGPRSMRFSPQHVSGESQTILLKSIHSQMPSDASQELAGVTAQSPDAVSPPSTSPTRVTFQDHLSPRNNADKREPKYHSGGSGISLPVSLIQVLGRGNNLSARNAPAANENLMPEASSSRDHRYSFLDMESTRSNSISTHSQSTRRSQRASASESSRSRRDRGGASENSNHSLPGSTFGHGRDDEAPLGLSMTMEGGPTQSDPSQSPNISLQAVSLPPLIAVPPLAYQPDFPQSAHPRDLSEILPSPTDSMPYTISEIDFRRASQSTSGTESRRASAQQYASGSHRGSHPPLPSPTFPSQTEGRHSYIVQKLMGVPAETGLSSPFVTGGEDVRVSGSSTKR